VPCQSAGHSILLFFKEYNYSIVALIAKGGIMAFNLVYLSQQDPQWKNDVLGFASDPKDTIGYVGCALTSVSMLLSGYGFSETPQSLNQKLKAKQGFVDSGIRWDVVCQMHPEVRLQSNVRCETSDAPLGQIDTALNAGQPVIVRVDASPNPGLQWHYVLVYARQDDDYLMLDPWPYRPGTDKPDLLMKRYSQGRPLKRAIQQVLFYNVAGAGGPIATPSSSTTTTPSQPVPASPATGEVYARVMDSVTWGLNIRSSKDTSSQANILVAVPAGTQLLLLDPTEAAKVSQAGQWLHVREPGGKEGYAAAQYVEKVQAETPAPVPEPAPSPATDAPAPTPSSSTSTPVPSTPIPSTPAPSPEPGKLTIVVSDAVGTGGLRLRKTPSLGGALVMVLAAGTRLTVLEPAGKAKAKVGKANQWIQVREPGGSKGYVGAAYVKLA
jgi:hypothetical protein